MGGLHLGRIFHVGGNRRIPRLPLGEFFFVFYVQAGSFFFSIEMGSFLSLMAWILHESLTKEICYETEKNLGGKACQQ